MRAARCASTAADSGVLPSSSRALAKAGWAASRPSTISASPPRIAAKSWTTGSGSAAASRRSSSVRSARQLVKPCSRATARCASARRAAGSARRISGSRSLASFFRNSRLGRSGSSMAHHLSMCPVSAGSGGRWFLRRYGTGGFDPSRGPCAAWTAEAESTTGRRQVKASCKIAGAMPHLVCGCCHGSTAAPIGLVSPRGSRRAAGAAHGRPTAEASRPTPNPGVQGYSPPPPPVSPIKGLIDFHTPPPPAIFGRAIDDDELAALAASRQMEAIVFKNHVTHTADRAWLVRKHVPGIKVFGGITLNRAVGGLNPQAVEWMWRMQGGYGRVVWFPTFDADNHVRKSGTAPSGLRVVDEGGAALPVVRDILRICAAQQLVVHTGHASAEEALALIEAAREEGCDRIVVTHAQFDVVDMNEAQMKKAASMGAKMELCALGMLVGPEAALEWMRHSPRVPLAETAKCIRGVGARHFVLGTDLGQSGNPTPADGLQMFVAGLQAEGVSRDEIETMGREVPGALLMG